MIKFDELEAKHELKSKCFKTDAMIEVDRCEITLENPYSEEKKIYDFGIQCLQISCLTE
jgi:hypothetical protein